MHIGHAIQENWFMPLAFGISAVDFTLARALPWSPPRPLEIGLILDFAVLLPLLYAVCYRRRGRVALIRAAALTCFGIWLAGRVIPPAHQELLAHLSPLRYVGMAVLLLIELRLAIAIYKAAFAAKPDEVQRTLAAAKHAGAPSWVIRVMAWEASLWRKAWDRMQLWLSRT